MDIIITFFRDILDGPLYIIVALLSGFFLCACIGYLAEQSQLKRQEANNGTFPQQQSIQPQPMAQPIQQSVQQLQTVPQQQGIVQPQTAQPVNIPNQNIGTQNNNISS